MRTRCALVQHALWRICRHTDAANRTQTINILLKYTATSRPPYGDYEDDDDDDDDVTAAAALNLCFTASPSSSRELYRARNRRKNVSAFNISPGPQEPCFCHNVLYAICVYAARVYILYIHIHIFDSQQRRVVIHTTRASPRAYAIMICHTRECANVPSLHQTNQVLVCTCASPPYRCWPALRGATRDHRSHANARARPANANPSRARAREQYNSEFVCAPRQILIVVACARAYIY